MTTRFTHVAALACSTIVAGLLFAACSSSDSGSENGSDGGSSGGDGSSGNTNDGAPSVDGTTGSDGSSGADGSSGDGSSSSDGSSGGDGSVDAGADASTPPLGAVCGAACPAGKKVCAIGQIDSICVSIDDPAFGCGPVGCSSSCPRDLPHTRGQSTCVAGACVFGGPTRACKTGWGSCDGDWTNGCEADLAKPTSCGACGTVCVAGQVCNGGVCAAACTPPLDDCGDGACRDFATDARGCNCRLCADDFATAMCSAGACGQTCDTGAKTCPNATGCFDIQNDPMHCGTGCIPCSVDDKSLMGPRFPAATCVAGKCSTNCPSPTSPCAVSAFITSCRDLGSDVSNCGACGSVCAGACVEGVCLPKTDIQLAVGFISLAKLAVDGANVYVTDSGGPGKVWQIDKATGAKTQIATLQSGVGAVAVDAAYVYWADSSAIRRAAIGGAGAVETIGSIVTRSIAVDDTYVYYEAGLGGIFRLPKAGGGAPDNVTTKSAYGVLADANKVYGWWYRQASGGIRERWFYAVDKATGALTYFLNQPSIGSFTGLGPAAVEPNGEGHIVLVSGSYPNLDGVMMCNRAGPGCGAIPRALAVDDCGAFWTNDNRVFRRSPGTNEVTLLTSAASIAGDLGLDADWVYWADEAFVGRVSKKRKPR